MSVVGIDFGNNACYISVARAGGIESIANDYSLRETPSYVGFGERQRVMGVNAKNQLLTNLKRTVFGFKHMLGRKYKDPVVQDSLAGLPFDVSEGKDGKVLIRVNYLGLENVFTPEEITAMLFTKLKITAEEALKTKVKDVVISCPSYFTDCERRALLNAGSIAGLNVLKLMNDTTATALAYGIYKQDLPAPEEKARNVVFVDVGHIGVQVAACSFNKGKLVMKASAHARGVGGKAFDKALVKYFAADFEKKTKLNAMKKPRAFLKLTMEVEKVKKQMSANINLLPLGIECFMEEKDLNGKVDRANFLEMVQPELQRIEEVMTECLKESEWKQDDIYAVEIIVGSTRIPAIKEAIERAFGKTPNTTLNADEAVSRGCALQCAILSPTFKVREFSVTDIQPFPIKLTWKTEQDVGDMVVFPKFHQVPFSKLLTFYRRDNFSVEAEYEKSTDNSSGGSVMDPFIGTFEIGEIRPLPDGGNQKVKVKVRMNLNGVFTVNSASMIEKHEIEEEVPMEVDSESTKVENDTVKKEENAPNEAIDQSQNKDKNGDSDMKDVDNLGKDKAQEDQPKAEEKPKLPPKMVKQKKIVSKNIDLPVTSKAVGSLSRDKIERALAQETKFTVADVQEGERLVAKNAVEEYIYDIRDKIHDELEQYIEEDSRQVFSSQLEEAENWLYEDGEDVEKPVYVDKLSELKIVGDAAKKRKTEFAGRQNAIESLGHSLQMAAKAINEYKLGDEKYEHLLSDDIEKVANLINEKKTWMDKSCAVLERTEKTTEPPVMIIEFYSQKDSFEAIARPILTKPKPKVEPPPPPKEPEKDISEKPENKGDVIGEEGKKMDVEEKAPTVNGGQTMDLD